MVLENVKGGTSNLLVVNLKDTNLEDTLKEVRL